MTTTAIIIAGDVIFFAVGVYFSQKIKDWFSGFPAAARAEISAAEAAIVAKIKSI